MDWFKLIKKHHIEIKQAFETAIEDPSYNNVEEVKKLLMAHALAEEAVIYPALKPDGQDDEQLEKEQTEAKFAVHELMHNYHSKFKTITKSKRLYVIAKLKEILEAVLTHAIDHEEKDQFLKLHNDLSKEKSDELGKEYQEKYNDWYDASENYK